MIASQGRVPPANTLSSQHPIPDIPDPIPNLPPLVRARPESEKQFKLHLKPSTDHTYKVQTWAGCIPNNQVSLVSFYPFAQSSFAHHPKPLHNLLQYILLSFASLLYSHTVSFHLIPHNSLKLIFISYFLMQPLTNHPLRSKLLHNILHYIFHSFASLLASYIISFTLASNNCLLQYHISYFFMQPLTGYLLCAKLLYSIFQYIFHSFVPLPFSHTVSFSLAPHNCLLQYHISYI